MTEHCQHVEASKVLPAGTNGFPVDPPDALGDPSISDEPILLGGRITSGLLLVTLGIFLLSIVGSWRDTRSDFPAISTNASASSQEILRINLNEATVEEITLVPGVGPVLAKRLITRRNEIGAFESLGDLRRVYGIGDRTLVRIATIGFVPEIPPWQRRTDSTPLPSTDSSR